MNPNFRLATSNDLPTVLALLDGDHSGLTKPRLDAILARIQRYPDYQIWIVEAYGSPCATFTLVTIDRIAHGGTSVALLDALRATGDDAQRIAGAAVAFARDLARQRGCSQLLLLGPLSGQLATVAGEFGFAGSALTLDPQAPCDPQGR
jgi:hypothetical protein